MSCDCSCVTAESVVKTARGLLNDGARSCAGATQDQTQEYAHWSQADLLSYAVEGLAVLVSLRPDAFVTVEEIELTAGSRQTIPDEYDALVGIVAGLNESGSEAGPVVATDDTFAHLAPSQCGPDSGDCGTNGEPVVVKSYSVFQQSQRHFTVSPPVPAGKTAKVMARLVKAPPCQLAASDCLPVALKFHPALVDWIVYRAFSKDIESAFALEASARHYRWFFETLEAQRIGEARFRSGYHLGMVGEEDGQLRNR